MRIDRFTGGRFVFVIAHEHVSPAHADFVISPQGQFRFRRGRPGPTGSITWGWGMEIVAEGYVKLKLKSPPHPFNGVMLPETVCGAVSEMSASENRFGARRQRNGIV